MYLFAAYLPHALCAGVCGTACLIADVATGTSVFHRNVRSTEMSIDQDQEFDDLFELAAEDVSLDGWDDVADVDLDGHQDDVLLGTEDVEWLHAMLYSDYADPADDDDRSPMNIPAHVVAQYGGM